MMGLFLKYSKKFIIKFILFIKVGRFGVCIYFNTIKNMGIYKSTRDIFSMQFGVYVSTLKRKRLIGRSLNLAQ